MNNGGLPYRVETMQWVDVPDVMAIESQSFTLPWSEYTYHHELLENTHSYYFVVRRLDQPAARKSASWWNRLWGKDEPAAIVGYGGFWFIVDEAHISTIASHPDWRGRGVGELLLLWMIEQAIELGAKIVTLEVRVTNSVAQQLYRKYGFEKVGRRPRYYRDNNEDADLMTVAQVDRAAYQTRLKQLRAALEDRLRREVVRGSSVHV